MNPSQQEQVRTLRNPQKISIDDEWYEGERKAIQAAREKANGKPAPAKFCECSELIISGKRCPFPSGHSCTYVQKRSELVPVAVALTNSQVSNDGYEWTRRFVEIMQRLSAPLLKQSSNGACEQKAV